MNLSFIDLFAGIGMFRMGLEKPDINALVGLSGTRMLELLIKLYMIRRENGLKMTSEMLPDQEYQQQIFGVPGSLAKTFQRMEDKKDWQEKSQDSSEKLYESLGKQMKLKTLSITL